MVKRTPPLAVAFVGTGEASPKIIESLLEDYTAPYADVTFVLPVADDYWSPTMDTIASWATTNDVPYVAVTTSDGVAKTLQPVLDGAADTMKVARVSTKLVQLLVQEKAEGDVALLVAWDDEDAEANTAVTKALNSQVRAFNLLDGLDEFSFDDEDDEGQDDSVDHEALDAKLEGDPDLGEEATSPAAADEYDSWGIRKLRAELRERADEHDIPDKTIGQLEKADAIRALRNVDAGKGKAEPQEREAESGKIAKKILADQEETRTTRARRAFAEGAAEGTDDEAQTLPRSKGSDILDNEEGDYLRDSDGEAYDDQPVAVGIVDKGITGPVVETGTVEDTSLRIVALQAASALGSDPVAVLTAARRFEAYLKGAAPAPGRPRADGSPAQPREINPETGKPIRRRRASGSTE